MVLKSKPYEEHELMLDKNRPLIGSMLLKLAWSAAFVTVYFPFYCK